MYFLIQQLLWFHHFYIYFWSCLYIKALSYLVFSTTVCTLIDRLYVCIINNMSTVRRSKCKCISNYISTADPSRRANSTVKELKTVWSSHLSHTGSTSSTLLELCSKRMTPHILNIILPLDHMKCDGFTF